MRQIPFSIAAFARALVVVSFTIGTLFGRSAPENIVLIVADDLGAHDLGCYGSRFFETPNLDRLAREGMRFSQAYSACSVCSPTRAALLTGKYPARLKLTDWISGHDFPLAKLRPPSDWMRHLPVGEVTLAELASETGYTTMHVGKWHLGGTGFGPEQQGFSSNIGGDNRGQPLSYFAPYGRSQIPGAPTGEYLTDREGAEAARFIVSNRDRPFFLNLWFYAVHTPLQAKADLVEKYRRKALTAGGPQTNATYAAMLESLDAAVGRVLSELENTGLADRTMVIFTSDNGGLVIGANPPTSNAPLRSGKGSPYEGGVRVPLIVKRPGVTRAGSECATPVITMDIAATVADVLANARGQTSPAGTSTSPPPAGAVMDGVSLVSLLRDSNATLARPNLYWHYPHYHPGGATPYASIRSGDWKLIQYYENGRHELFNLRNDPGESSNLVASEPTRVMDLARKLFEWQGSVGAQWPMYNSFHETTPLQQNADGALMLHSREASVHGTTLRYEPMPFKNTLGWWSRADDWASWNFVVSRPGIFEVEILQGCGRDQGGSEVNVESGNLKVPFVVEETGHFQNFVPRRVGKITLAMGTNQLALRPQRKAHGAIMDVRQVRLVPENNPSVLVPGAMNLLAAHRIVCLGDSITYSGEWISYLETWLRTRFPDANVEFLDLGLPSETVSGLSEPGHAGGAFPRPELNERLARVLAKAKPDLILACYGMNDGIYYPFGEERFQRFRDGMRRLREQAAHEGIRVVHLTPPVFDPVPLAGRTLPAGRDEYRSPFEGYNSVLDQYSDWLVSQRTNGWEVVDVHSPMNLFLQERRRLDPKFLLAGDGVHLNTQGHWLIAREILRHLGAETAIVSAETPEALVKSHPRGEEIFKLVQQRQLATKDSWLTYAGHRRPGMNEGKSIEEAQRESTEIDQRLRSFK